MSEMEVSDIPVAPAEAVAPVAPEVAPEAAPETAAPEAVAVEKPKAKKKPTAPKAKPPVAPEATPVAHQQGSNTPVEAEVVETFTAAIPLEDAVRVLIIYVRDGRRAGDGDLDAAIADVEAALAA